MNGFLNSPGAGAKPHGCGVSAAAQGCAISAARRRGSSRNGSATRKAIHQRPTDKKAFSLLLRPSKVTRCAMEWQSKNGRDAKPHTPSAASDPPAKPIKQTTSRAQHTTPTTLFPPRHQNRDSAHKVPADIHPQVINREYPACEQQYPHDLVVESLQSSFYSGWCLTRETIHN